MTAPILLLTTTGARSKQPRSTPLLYQQDGERFVLIASKGGNPRHPAWYHNLRAKPEGTVLVGGREILCSHGHLRHRQGCAAVCRAE